MKERVPTIYKFKCGVNKESTLHSHVEDMSYHPNPLISFHYTDSTISPSYIQNFKPLDFCGCTAWFVSDLVRSPCSHNEAHEAVPYNNDHANFQSPRKGDCLRLLKQFHIIMIMLYSVPTKGRLSKAHNAAPYNNEYVIFSPHERETV